MIAVTVLLPEAIHHPIWAIIDHHPTTTITDRVLHHLDTTTLTTILADLLQEMIILVVVHLLEMNIVSHHLRVVDFIQDSSHLLQKFPKQCL